MLKHKENIYRIDIKFLQAKFIVQIGFYRLNQIEKLHIDL